VAVDLADAGTIPVAAAATAGGASAGKSAHPAAQAVPNVLVDRSPGCPKSGGAVFHF
jgi:hypothetical protein